MNIFDLLQPPAVIGSLAFGATIFTKTITDYILRKKLIDKGLVGPDAAMMLQSQLTKQDGRFSSLKWGLIIFFGGIGLTLIEFIPTRMDSPLPFGILAVSLSLGFLVYYFFVKKETK